jgi:hypothetical protein
MLRLVLFDATTCPAVVSSLSSMVVFEGGTILTGHGGSKREERLVKALRDNLRRRKAAPREPAKPSGGSETAPRPTRRIEPKPKS